MINLPPKDVSPPPSAILVLLHGLMGHCCRLDYLGLYESLSDARVEVYALDHHGHGRSDSLPRGYAKKFDDYVVDLLAYIRQCQGEFSIGYTYINLKFKVNAKHLTISSI